VLGDAELAALYSPDQIVADADFFGCPVHRLNLQGIFLKAPVNRSEVVLGAFCRSHGLPLGYPVASIKRRL
jgi:hypothetical protein